MNKKLLLVSILAVLTLVAISFASAINSTTTNTKKKESPLFGIRTRLAIGERLQDLKETIKTRFVGERVFFLPFQLLTNEEDISARQLLQLKIRDTVYDFTCYCASIGCTCKLECDHTYYTCEPYC